MNKDKIKVQTNNFFNNSLIITVLHDLQLLLWKIKTLLNVICNTNDINQSSVGNQSSRELRNCYLVFCILALNGLKWKATWALVPSWPPVTSVTKKVNISLAKPPLKFSGGLAKLGLTHWGQVTHICVGKLTTIGSDNGLSPGRRQAVIWTSAGILLIGFLGTNFSEISIGIQPFSFKKMHFENVVYEMASIWSRPQCVNYPSEIRCRWIVLFL